MKIGFIGLGKLGMPCAEVMSEKYDVTGYDIFKKYSDKISISDTLESAVVGKDIIFIAVQTPHDPEYDGSMPISHLPNKNFDYSVLTEVLQKINKVATKNQLIVLISTVLPGTIRKQLINYITNARFIYNPYLIAMGSIQYDMLNPEMIIIGTEDGSNTKDAEILTNFYKSIIHNDTRFILGTWDETESIKIFYNTFISTKIALVNMIQDVAMKNGNINVDVVTNALSDSTTRIMSSKYMTAGMGDAGPCHPRDNIALRWLAEDLDLGYDIFNTIIHAREMQAHNLSKYLVNLQNTYDIPIIIHGKSYKPDVDILSGSYSILIGNYLSELQATFTYSDPLTFDTVKDYTSGIILLAHNRQITYGCNEDQELYFKPGNGSIIVDPWRKFTSKDKSLKIIHYGNTRPLN